MTDISYKQLFKLLIDRDLKKGEFAKLCCISAPTLSKLSKNEYVSMEVLVRICKTLHCQLNDIVEVNLKEQ